MGAWLFASAAADQAYDCLLASAAVQMAESIATDGDRVAVEITDAAFETLAMAADDRIFYAVRDPAGRLLTGYPEVPAPDRALPLNQTHIDDARLMDSEVRIVTVGRYVASPQPGWMSVVVAQTRLERRAASSAIPGPVPAIVSFTLRSFSRP